MSRTSDLYLSLGFKEKGLSILVTPPDRIEHADRFAPEQQEKLWQVYEEQIKAVAEEHLPVHGGVLFRAHNHKLSFAMTLLSCSVMIY